MENNIGLVGNCPGPDIGLSITEFARAAQTTRAAVGKFIAAGWLSSVTTDLGQIRVTTSVSNFFERKQAAMAKWGQDVSLTTVTGAVPMVPITNNPQNTVTGAPTVMDLDETNLHKMRVRLTTAGSENREAQDRYNMAKQHLEAEMEFARSAGIGWAETAKLTGLSENQVAYSFHRNYPSAREKARRALIPEHKKKDRTGPRHGKGSGMHITEYARQSGFTRSTIYAWMNAGMLDFERNESGQVRILTLPEDAPSKKR